MLSDSNMRLTSLKAHFKINTPIKFDERKNHKSFKLEDATLTVYAHTKNVLHVSGLKSLFHLEQCKQALKKKYQVLSLKIDNRMYSHKDSKCINMKSLYDQLCEKQRNGKFNIIYEPELFPGLMIKHKDKSIPTAIIFRTGSYNIMGGKIENLHYIESIVKKSLNDNVKTKMN